MSEAAPPGNLFGQFAEVLGHTRALAALRRAAAAGRPHHAYLLLGPRGIGKMTVARALLSALLCERRGGDACGACGACHKLQTNAHTGVHLVERGGKSETISVEQVAEIQRQLTYRRLEGAFRVVLIDDAGSMNESAQNKLLKTLEEPPQGTVLILCALHPGQLIQTVRSRTHQLHLGVVPEDELVRWLVERHGATPEVAQGAARAARGVPGLALGLIDDVLGAEQDARRDLLLAALRGEPGAVADSIAAVDRDVPAARALLVVIQELLRDQMVAATGGTVRAIHEGANRENGALERCSAEVCARWIERIEDVHEAMTRNVHPGALVEELLLQLAEGTPRG